MSATTPLDCLTEPTTPPAAPPRRRGRIPVATLTAERRRHIAAAVAVLYLKAPKSAVAKDHDVDRVTIDRWIKLALTYDDPMCRFLAGLGAIRTGRPSAPAPA